MHRPGHAVDDDRALQRRRVQPAAAPRAPGHGAALLPDGGQVMADAAGLVDRQLGRERPAADTRRVGLGDAQHVVQQVGPDARAGGGVAGHAVARRHVRVGAVVDVEQRALRAFEQQVRAVAVGLVQPVADVGQHRQQLLGGPHRAVVDRLVGQRLAPSGSPSARRCAARAARAACAPSAPGASGPARAARGAPPCPRRPARCPCRWCRSCREPLVSRSASRARSSLDVEGQDQRAGLAEEQARAHVDAGRLEPLDLGQQVRRIDDHAVADVAGDAVAHDARRDQLQRRLAGP